MYESKFHLVGGIGNQLFGYFAGLAHSICCQNKVNFVINSLPINSTSILELNINPNQFLQSNKKYLGVRLATQVRNLYLKKQKKIYVSNVIGFDRNILKSSSETEFFGYFQSYKYFDLVPKEISLDIFNLKKYSNWFLEMKSLISIAKPNVVHIRRGDYMGLDKSHGLLGLDYYKNAINYLENLIPNNPYWVFSDDIEQSKFEFANCFPENTKWIAPPASSSPIESLLLMSLGASNIIANSTFSWWAATLNSGSKIKIAPNSWFRGMDDPKYLIPANWQRIQNLWRN
jgi:hypothetical protein